MANSSTLQILIDIKSRLAGLEQSVAQMRQLKQETENVSRAGSALSGVFTGLAAGVGIGLTQQLSRLPQLLAESVRSGISFNATLESSQLGIAGIIKQFDQSGRIQTFDDAIKASSRTIDILKAKAKETAATFQELVAGFQANAGPLFQAGINNAKQQVEVVIAASQALAAMDIPTNQLNQELRAIFQGDVSKNSRLNQVLEITKEQIDKAIASGTAYRFIMDKLAAFAEAGARAQDTLNTRLSNFSDIMTELKAIGTSELFEQIRIQIGEINAALSTPEARESAREIGAALKFVFDDAVESAKIAKQMFTDIGTAIAFISGQSGKVSFAAWQQFTAEQEKALSKLRETVGSAVTLEQRESARNDIAKRVVELMERESRETGQMKMYLADAVAETIAFRNNFSAIVGTTEQAGRNIRDIITALDAAQAASLKLRIAGLNASADAARAKTDLDNELALAKARASGNEAVIRSEQRRQSIEDFKQKAIVRYGETAGRVLTEEYAGHLRIIDGIAAHKEALKGVSDELKRQKEILTEITNHQSAIRDDPFLTVDEKNARLIPLLHEEAAQLRVTGDAWGAYRAEREAASLTFGGGLQAGLVAWISQMGSAAHQVSGIITNTLNTAISSTTQLLTDAIFTTGDWGKAWLNVAKTAVSALIQVGIQMVVTSLLGQFLREKETQGAMSAGARMAGGYAPAAAGASIATGGTSAVIGALAAAAAIAAIIALLTGFEGGGYTGAGGRKAIAGVVHGGEFVHPKDIVDHYGLPFMTALHRRAIPVNVTQELIARVANYRYTPATPRLGSFEVGGAVAAISQASEQREAASIGSMDRVRDMKVVVLNDVNALRKEIFNSKESELFVVNAVNGQWHRIRKS